MAMWIGDTLLPIRFMASVGQLIGFLALLLEPCDSDASTCTRSNVYVFSFICVILNVYFIAKSFDIFPMKTLSVFLQNNKKGSRVSRLILRKINMTTPDHPSILTSFAASYTIFLSRAFCVNYNCITTILQRNRKFDSI